MKWFLIALMPLALAGCVTEQAPVLPMTLGPSEAAAATCLQIGDAPTFDCTAQAASVIVQ
jgi:hypothetical protein